MKLFDMPEMEIVKIVVADIITTSPTGGEDPIPGDNGSPIG